MGSIGRRYCRLIHKKWPSIKLGALRSGYGKSSDEEGLLTECFSSIDKALEWNPEAAIVASPASLHMEQSCRLANKGIPLLIEKPVATGLEDPSLYQTLLSFDEFVPIYIGYVLRHDPGADWLRDEMSTGVLGDLVSADFCCGSWLPDWRSDQNYKESVSARRELGGGALLELSHELDMAQWLLGPLTLVNSFIRNSGLLDIEVEDQVNLLARTPKGSPVSIRIDFCTRPARRTISLNFTNGEIIWDLLSGTVSKNVDKLEKTMHKIGASSDERFFRQLELFWKYPKRHQTAMCSLKEALEVVEIIQQAKTISAKIQGTY